MPAGLVFAILVYVTVDLSAPMVPGAFVFEPGDSVESAQGSRAREVSPGVHLTGPVRDPVVLAPPSARLVDRPAQAGVAAPLRHHVVKRPAHTVLTSAPHAEEPH
jgi:hypothetical protein